MKRIITAALVFMAIISMGSALQVNELLGDVYQVSFASPDGLLVTVDDPIGFAKGDGGYFRDLEMSAKQEVGNKTIGIAIAETTPPHVLGLDYQKNELERLGFTEVSEMSIDSRPAILGTMDGGTGAQADYEVDLGTKSIEVIITAFYLSNEELNQLLDTFHIKEI